MKMFDAVKMKDIVKRFNSKTMLAAVAILAICFKTCRNVTVWPCTVTFRSLSNYAYAQKRIISKVVHLRKFALFPGCAKFNA
jgi:hypothetical protein